MVLERIKKFIDSKGISVYTFEKKVGISNASFAHQLKKEGAIGTDKLEDILNVFSDLSAEWLLRGKGEMLIADNNYQEQGINLNDIEMRRQYNRLVSKVLDLQDENTELRRRISELEGKGALNINVG